MRVLITGITGFVGSHLAEYLLKMKDVEVWGIERWRSSKTNIEHLKQQLKIIECDLKDATSIEKAVREIKPEKIFHLAAQSFVPTSWHAPAETISTNIIGQLNLFEAVRETGIDPVIQIAGSSEEYGMVYPNEIPIKETNPLRPLSPYGVSKVGQDMLGYQYFMSYNIKVIRTRGFNHTGPRRGDVFVESNFAQQVAKIEKGLQEPIIRVGNLEARRDYTDVRDMVRAYWLATEKCKPGEEYNICTGIDWTIQKVLDTLLSKSNIKVEVKPDPARMRPSDVMVLLGDNTKFCAATGWKPEIPFEQTLSDLLNYWRERV
ncbi:MAG: GDP-mannose 4,6-dehydratase [Elusimicrobia bacterium RIFOXYA2_FULL_50_26]|nr:MAG: GDP-mannose 4,6-dehydratase [Elusimicrobia bacterium RIFOXYA2_FULL_50_26]OGS24939.1 MAG: GDP-mannose 4,6-dehydratase [Elusimicrobia bacterium RIFOXYB2_FULL_50_12]